MPQVMVWEQSFLTFLLTNQKRLLCMQLDPWRPLNLTTAKQKRKHLHWFLLWRNFTRCYSGTTSRSWQTTSHYCQHFARKRELQCTQLVDNNAGQSSYWDMISTYSTARLQNLVWLMPCHVSSVGNQSQMKIPSSLSSTWRTIFSLHSLIVSEQFLWQE